MLHHVLYMAYRILIPRVRRLQATKIRETNISMSSAEQIAQHMFWILLNLGIKSQTGSADSRTSDKKS
jgi:lactate dehydrogenase-like 2-hydroxyacid dehydrogenase